MKKIKIIPRGKQVLVKPDEEKSRILESGLVTPDNVEQERKAFGVVIAVGSEITDIKKGDKVIYGTYSGDDISFADTGKEVDYKLIYEDEILAFIEE